MTFQLSEVDLDTDFSSLFATEWAAWTHPHQALWELMSPIPGAGPDAESEAIKRGAALQLAGTEADPYSRWVKVVDTTTGKIVAGALWKFYPSNPYRVPLGKFEATWYPPGELRGLVTSTYEQLRAWRPRCMSTAHACGYSVLIDMEMNFETASPGEDWVRLVNGLQANPVAIMWRPAGGKYMNGETVVPWEGKPRGD